MRLSKCHFCGSGGVKIVIKWPYDREKKAYVKCNKCHARGSLVKGENAEYIACAIWNNEPIPEEVKENNQLTLEELVNLIGGDK
jgi:hypothetical protein